MSGSDIGEWVAADLEGMRDDPHALYRDLHAHPQLSLQEHRTSELLAARLRAMDLEDVTTGIGGTGVVGFLRNGDGPTICYWLLGGTDADLYAAAIAGCPDAPSVATNHSPCYAPVPEPTISTGVTALVAATLAWLARP